MHELSIAMSIIDIAEEESQKHGDAGILAVHLKIGRMSGVVIDALQSAFELAREDTILADAKLVIQDVPVLVRCRTCDGDQPADSIRIHCCSVCGTISSEMTQGHELEVVAMELEPEKQLQ